MARISSMLLVSLALVDAGQGPCDIFNATGTPCVAAHSTTRALYGAFALSLYRVQRLSDNATLDVNVMTPGGFANSSAQDAFCSESACVIQRIYDQSPRGNHLDIAPAGGHVHTPDQPVNASRFPTSASGHAVYAAFFEGGQGYRIDDTRGVATGNDPETLYMVTSGQHVNGGCCFDYGNAETNNDDTGVGSMEAVYFGTRPGKSRCAGAGPWVEADLENGLWGGGAPTTPTNTPLAHPFVTAMVKGGTHGFALKGGDATQGALVTMYDGARPPGYQPMKKQGAIILGIGGDNSNTAVGTFFEGAITAGYSTDAADAAVQANIVAAGYGR